MENIMYWKNGGFYDVPVEGGVEITSEYWRELLDGQSAGKAIVTDTDGKPVLVDEAPRTTEELRASLVDAIRKYDKSDAVNRFTLDGVEMWLDRSVRSSLSYSLAVEKQSGKTTTEIWTDSVPAVSVTVEIEHMEVILRQLELYAKATYDSTQRHIANVYALVTDDEIKAYDYTAGYPDRLIF